MSTSSARFGIAASTAGAPSRSARARNRSALSGAVERREQVRRRAARARSSSRRPPRRARSRPRAARRASVSRSRGRAHGRSALTTSTGPLSIRRSAPSTACPWPPGSSATTTSPTGSRGREHVLEHRLREVVRTSSGAGASRCFAVSPRKGTTTVGMPWRDYPAVQGSPPDNAEIADAARPVRRAARARGRRAVHGAGLPARGRPDPLDAGAGRGARPAGPRRASCAGSARGSNGGCASSSRPGEIAELRRARARGLAGARRARALPRRLGQADAGDRPRARRPHARRAAGGGRGRAPAGGAGHRAGDGAQAARRARAGGAGRSRRGRCCSTAAGRSSSRSRRRSAAIAAGDPRRWRDASERLAVVVPGDPSRCSTASRRLPQIVAVVERGERRALGVTVEGVPVELVVAEPARLGTELVRATGSPRVGRGARAAARRARRGRRLRRARAPVRAARAARGRCAASRRPRRGGRDPRRPPLPHDLVGREGDDPRDGPRRARRAATSTSRSATTRVSVGVVPGLDADDVRRQAEEIAAANERARAVPRPARDRVRHPAGRLARPPRRRAGRARLGAGERPRRPARLARGADQARARGARLAVRQLPQPSDRAADQPPAAERASTWRPSSRGSREQGRAVEVNGLAPTGSTCATSTSAWRARRVCRSSARPTRTRSAASRTCELSVATARRGGAGPPTC